MREPFPMIDQFLLTSGFEDECESLTLLGVEDQTLLQLGLVAVGDEGDVIFGQEEDLVVTGLRDQQLSSSKEASSSKVPDVLPPDDGGQHREVPEVEAGEEEIQAAPDVRLEMEDEELKIHEDLVITPTSSVKLLRDACRWLGISQSGSKRRMFDRCKKSMEEAYRRNLLISAQEQYKANILDAVPVPVPPQPSDEERALHNLTHIPYKAWCKFCVMSQSCTS